MGKKKKDERKKALLGSRTLEFQLVIGVLPGYGHENAGTRMSPAQKVAGDWQEIGEDLFREYKVYPAGVVVPGRTLYPAAHGCPREGETTVTIAGLANPRYVEDLGMWRFVVEKAAAQLRKKLDQTTAYLSFRKVRFLYLTEEIPF